MAIQFVLKNAKERKIWMVKKELARCLESFDAEADKYSCGLALMLTLNTRAGEHLRDAIGLAEWLIQNDPECPVEKMKERVQAWNQALNQE